MTTPATKPGAWFRSSSLPKLALAIALSAPIAGAVVAVILGFTVFQDAIFMFEDPQHDSVFVKAGFLEILANTFVAAFSGLMIGGIIGWPILLVFGMPVHAFLLRATSARAWVYIIAGAVLGAAAGAFRFLSSGGTANPDDLIPLLAVGAATGIFTVMIFWLVRRPDKDAPSFKA